VYSRLRRRISSAVSRSEVTVIGTSGAEHRLDHRAQPVEGLRGVPILG
jgi:hypothetical protein